MIVGGGLLAKTFEQYRSADDILIFASGVSNSKETDPKQYAREYDLLMSHKDTNQRLVYFSTTSIYDRDLAGSSYIKHKTCMEKSIINHFKAYNIFRLPTVVGKTTNQHTFFNGIKNAIEQGQVHIKENAVRYIIDADDLMTHLPSIIDLNVNGIMNTCFSNKARVKDIVALMGTIMKREYIEHLIDGGCDYDIDNTQFISKVSADSVGMTKDYTYITLKKYLQSYDNILSPQ